MTEPAARSEAARLNELAALTREYAGFSYSSSGLGHTVVGAWCVLVFCVALRSTVWGRIAGLWAPIVAVCALAAARSYYQRLGQVTEKSGPPPSKAWVRKLDAWVPWVIALMLSDFIVVAVIHLEAWSGGDARAYWAIVLALGSVPFLFVIVARVRVRLGSNLARIILLLTLASALRLADGYVERIQDLVGLGVVAVAGAGLAMLGIGEHQRYRRLERRLAALKART